MTAAAAMVAVAMVAAMAAAATTAATHARVRGRGLMRVRWIAHVYIASPVAAGP